MTIKKRKFPAIRTEFYTVYHVSYTRFCGPSRSPLISFPEKADAEKWMKLHTEVEGKFDIDKYPAHEMMIESMPVTIRSWTP